MQRIVIVNKNKARVHMRAGGGGEQTGQGHYWFSLGSVNGFEKKLEQAQAWRLGRNSTAFIAACLMAIGLIWYNGVLMRGT